jgi:hypothetical protein
LDTLQVLLQVFAAPEGRGQYGDEGSLRHKFTMPKNTKKAVWKSLHKCSHRP